MLIKIFGLINVNHILCTEFYSDLPCRVVNIKSKAFIAFIACPFISLSSITDTTQAREHRGASGSNDRKLFSDPVRSRSHFLRIRTKSPCFDTDKWEVFGPKPVIDCDDTNKAMPYFFEPLLSIRLASH